MNSDISLGKLTLIIEKWFICVNICALLYKVKYVNEFNCYSYNKEYEKESKGAFSVNLVTNNNASNFASFEMYLKFTSSAFPRRVN